MAVIGPHFVDVINTSLEVGLRPLNSKTSMVMPTPKVPGTIKIDEFRPDNTLPTYEEGLVAVINEQLQEYVENKKIVIEKQSEFRKNHSCESALNLILINWKEQIEEGNMIVAIFLDLKRAFETIDRKRLQKTKFNGAVSEDKQVHLGVPQGSKLAALLFLIYINDMKDCLLYLSLVLFADDTLLYYCGKDINEINQRINEDMERLHKWLYSNKLKLNIGKTKFMVINGRNVDQQISVSINRETIERV